MLIAQWHYLVEGKEYTKSKCYVYIFKLVNQEPTENLYNRYFWLSSSQKLTSYSKTEI